jgi:hypothetical protein
MRYASWDFFFVCSFEILKPRKQLSWDTKTSVEILGGYVFLMITWARLDHHRGGAHDLLHPTSTPSPSPG